MLFFMDGPPGVDEERTPTERVLSWYSGKVHAGGRT